MSLFTDLKLYPAPHDPHRCAYCSKLIVPGEFAKVGKRWISADCIKVFWFHAGCPVSLVKTPA